MNIRLECLVVCALLLATPGFAADSAEVALASTRTEYSVAEPIELSVLCNDSGAKAVTLTLRHSDGSSVQLAVPIDATAKSQSRVVAIKPGMLKPGSYTAACGNEAGVKSAAFIVAQSEHPNPYPTYQWTSRKSTRGGLRAKGGWMYMNSDYANLHPRTPAAGDVADHYIGARMKPYALMICGGGHQLELKNHNDWGDPWVQRTIAWRLQLAALSNRIYPIAGLHVFDEPGLTWWPMLDSEGKKASSPFAIPHQLEEFEKLSGKKIPDGPFGSAAPKFAGIMDTWVDFFDMRMKYLEQAWNATVWGTNSVHPSFMTLNQVSSSYAPGCATDGVDSRQNRPYAVISGHGGYSDLPFGTYQPVRSAESMHGFSWNKPNYYLPMWYTHTWASMRNAVWMSFATKLEGMMYTPEQDCELAGFHGYHGSMTVFEMADINRRLAMVGGVMNQLPKSLAPVAVLYSHRQHGHDLATANSPELWKIGSPQYATQHGDAVSQCFFRVMECGLTCNWIDEVEAAEKGADFLKQWKVIMCPRLTIAEPKFRKALEDYIAAGGKLIQANDDKLLLPGATLCDHKFGITQQYYLEQCKDTGASSSPNYSDLAWRKWNNAFAPNFAKDLAAWIGEQPYASSNTDVLLAVHGAGAAKYVFFANNAQDAANPRVVKHELIPAETTVKLPAAGVVYDLFNGGVVPVANGSATIKLPAGDGACWLHLPAAPGAMNLSAKVSDANLLQIELSWGRDAFLPFRLRIFDPAGNKVDELFRATTLAGKFSLSYPLGINATPGNWRIEAAEWLTGSRADATAAVKATPELSIAKVDNDAVSIYFNDAERIAQLFAGKANEPDFSKLNWDAKRVFRLDARKFAVFGPGPQAEKIAAALRNKGMDASANPAYAIDKFIMEPGRGGAGPREGADNYENVYAHSVVLAPHPLAVASAKRGHINRPTTASFPGPGRAFIQWGAGGYQAGFENVWAFGDLDVATAWLLSAIDGKPAASAAELKGGAQTVHEQKQGLPRAFVVAQEIRTYDTPVAVDARADGACFIALNDGSVNAYAKDGKQLWSVRPLLECGALAVSPKGDRIAVAGYPGLLILDAADGKTIGGHCRAPNTAANPYGSERLVSVAWNSAGTRAAAGWLTREPKKVEPLGVVIVDAQGQELPAPKELEGVVLGVAFVPNTDTLLVGAKKLFAVNAADGSVLWNNDIGGASAFAFDAEAKICVAGGWGKTIGRFAVADGKLTQSVKVESIVGGIALLPDGSAAIAAWGGTRPLAILTAGAKAAEPLYQSTYAFQNVLWSPAHNGLIAAEQGGALWLLSADGKPQAQLSEDAGTTAIAMKLAGNELLCARMNRTTQRIGVK